jgi:hypothetical protein
MNENPYSERYRNYSPGKLLDILNNADKYEALAVETAKEELSGRNLSEKELEDAKNKLQAGKQKEEERNKKIGELTDKVKSRSNTFFDHINPVQPGIPTPEKAVRMLSLVLCYLLVWPVIRDWKQFWAFFTGFGDPNMHVNLLSLLVTIAVLLPPFMIIPFWKKKRTGWMFVFIYCAFTIFFLISGIIMEYRTQPQMSGLFANMLPKPNPLKYLEPLLIYSGLLVSLSVK